jgi:L-aminopeptidase/D-esterase-like protein
LFDTALRVKGGRGTSTTIGLVATDATLNKAQAMRLAIMAHDGLARAVLPAHAPLDGDTIFAASTGLRPVTEPAVELTELGHLAIQVMARAIARGVYEATALPVPGAQQSWRDRFAPSG